MLTHISPEQDQSQLQQRLTATLKDLASFVDDSVRSPGQPISRRKSLDLNRAESNARRKTHEFYENPVKASSRNTMHFFSDEKTPTTQQSYNEILSLSLPALKNKAACRFDAVETYLARAESGDAFAQYELGLAYLQGAGAVSNEDEAVKWLKMASDNGCTEAQYRMGRYHFKLDNIALALDYFRLASDKSEKASYYIGHCHFYGLGPLLKDYSEAVAWFRKSSDYKKSQTRLGICYFFGYSVSQNYEVALEWFRKAEIKGCSEVFAFNASLALELAVVISTDTLATKGNNLEAKFHLAVSYHYGLGVAENVKYATKLYLEAAESGNASAQIGRGVEQDYTLAARFYRKGCQQNNAEAQCNLASLYQRGLGVDQDNDEAIRLYKLSAENMNARAMYSLGLCYQFGSGVYLNRTIAAEWFEKAAKLGKCYYHGIGYSADFEDAVHWFMKAAEQGNSDSLYYLGLCSEKGRGLEKSTVAAMSFYRKAASYPSGHAEAELAIGKMYYFGRGIHKDLELASTWFEMSSSKGNSEAQLYLGLCYFEGFGCTKDLEKALHQFYLSATKDNADAQYMLGLCCEKGLGRHKSITDAGKWYRKAANLGSEDAAKKLGSASFKIWSVLAKN